MSSTSALIEKILRLKQEKKAIILAHNYQRPEVQDVADYVDDSVGLARRAMEEKEARIILHCSVDFMAETAAVLNPDKKVLIPSLGAKCPMAAMLPAFQLRAWKRKYPKAPVVLYVNTHAEAKANCDVCCTSANAVKIVEALKADEVIFGPDANLAMYVQNKTGKKVIPIPERGFCQTHVLFLREDILLLKERFPNATVMVHPECTPQVHEVADFVGSTSQMCDLARRASSSRFIVGTEVGLLHRLRRENPGKVFIPAYEDAMCVNMKLNTLERVLHALKEEQHVVTVPKPVARRAYASIKRMFDLTAT